MESLPETLCCADLSATEAFNSELLSTLSASFAVSSKPTVCSPTTSTVWLDALSSQICASKTRLLSFSSSSISSDFSGALSFSRSSGQGSFSGRVLLIRMRRCLSFVSTKSNDSATLKSSAAFLPDGAEMPRVLRPATALATWSGAVPSLREALSSMGSPWRICSCPGS